MPEAPSIRWQLLPRAQQRVMPWRNGLGTTREIAIEPPDATLDRGFAWRVSSAHVGADGPFSCFPGIDRTLFLWRGKGMRLDLDGATVHLDRPFARADFAGEQRAAATLLAGPIDDLNVMVDRTRCRAESVIVRDAERTAAIDGTLVLIALTQCALTVQGDRAPRTFALAEGDALRADIGPYGLVRLAIVGVALCAEFRSVSK